MRLFFAVSLPDAVLSSLNEARQALMAMPSVRAVRPENAHITLSFLGDVPAQDVRHLMAQARQVGVLPGSASLNGTLHGFPHSSRWKVAAAGINDDTGLLAELNKRLPQGEQAQKSYVPHITLARSNVEQTVLPTVLIKPVSFEIKEFFLVESTLSAGGPRYQIVDSFSI